MAPANFGQFSNDLLVGNFGDGTIHAYDPTTGALLGTVGDKNGAPLVIDGLWALQFGHGLFNQATNSLFFTSGPDGEAHGLYGSISSVPEPSTLVHRRARSRPACRRPWRVDGCLAGVLATNSS